MALSIGLIGLGGFAQHTIIPGIQLAPGLELRAVYDQSETALREVGAGLPEGSVCASGSEVIQRNDIDLVYVATPPMAHRQYVEETIATGKNIVCEKPFSRGFKDAAELAKLAADAGLVTCIDHEMRYAAVYRYLREQAAAGTLGEVIYTALNFAADYGCKPTYRPTYYWNFGSLREAGGGILRQHVSHFIDLVLFMHGGIEAQGGQCSTTIKEKPLLIETAGASGERVFSAGEMRAVDAEDTVALAGMLPNGAPVSLTATWATPVPTGTRWHLQGSEGALVYQSDVDVSSLWGGSVTQFGKGVSPSAVKLPPDRFPEVGPSDPRYMSSLVAAELLDVANSIDTGQPGQFSTFASECEVWKAIESWRS